MPTLTALESTRPPRWAALAAALAILGASLVPPRLAAADAALPADGSRAAAPPPDAGYLLPDGAIRIIGIGDLAGIVARWDELFSRTHPAVAFHFVRSDDLAALQSLTYDAAALAAVGGPFLHDAMGPYRILVKAPPFGIRVAHGSLNPAAAVSPQAIVVPRGNPLDRLSLTQVMRIFSVGDRRSEFTRWSQLGVGGELGGLEIHPCGLPPSDHYPSEDAGFAETWFWGRFNGAPPPWNYRSAPTYAGVAQAVARDPQAIGITGLNCVNPDLKVVAVSGGVWAAPSRGGTADLAAGTYPLDRSLYLYARRRPGRPLDPLVLEYLRLVLSREGQQAVADDPLGYRPLTGPEAEVERGKLE